MIEVKRADDEHGREIQALLKVNADLRNEIATLHEWILQLKKTHNDNARIVQSAQGVVDRNNDLTKQMKVLREDLVKARLLLKQCKAKEPTA